MRSNEIEDGNDYAIGDVAGHRLRWHVVGRKDGRIEAIPVDLDGAITGDAQSLGARSFKCPWMDEVIVRNENKQREARWRAERDTELAARAAVVKRITPAFRGISVSTRDVGIWSNRDADQEKTLDLADEIERTFAQGSQTVGLSLDALIAISDRIRTLSQELTGATWVGGQDGG